MMPRPRAVPRDQMPGAITSDAPRAESREQLLAEYLRHFLCHLGPGNQPETFAPQPVHAVALRAAVRCQLGELADDAPAADWPAADLDRDRGEIELPDLFSLVLHKLAVLGEAAPVGEGFYLPAPPRRVDLPGGVTLAVGGLPTPALARRVGDVRSAAGLGRLVTGAAAEDVPRQPAADWLAEAEGGGAREDVSLERGAAEWRLTVPRALPRAAMRLLYALACEDLVEGRPERLRFHFAPPVWGMIEPSLQLLRIRAAAG
jgi:hypothetical protein